MSGGLSRSAFQQQKAANSSDSAEAIYVAQYALKEAGEHARRIERRLWEMQEESVALDDAAERLQHRLSLQRSEGSIMDEASEAQQRQHNARLAELQSRVEFIEQEIQTDRAERLRLLRVLDMYVNGGPTPKLADFSFIAHNQQIASVVPTPMIAPESHAQVLMTVPGGAARSFARVMAGLAETNSALLDHHKYFTLAAEMLEQGIVQRRRGYRINTEECILAAAVSVGITVALVASVAAISEDDLGKL